MKIPASRRNPSRPPPVLMTRHHATMPRHSTGGNPIRVCPCGIASLSPSNAVTASAKLRAQAPPCSTNPSPPVAGGLSPTWFIAREQNAERYLYLRGADLLPFYGGSALQGPRLFSRFGKGLGSTPTGVCRARCLCIRVARASRQDNGNHAAHTTREDETRRLRTS